MKRLADPELMYDPLQAAGYASPDFAEAQLAAASLDGLELAVISDRHLVVHGAI
jgi:hypothetical protein